MKTDDVVNRLREIASSLASAPQEARAAHEQDHRARVFFLDGAIVAGAYQLRDLAEEIAREDATAQAEHVTADSLTDEQIRAEMARLDGLRSDGFIPDGLVGEYTDCRRALSLWLPDGDRNASRARIAAAINARNATL